MSLFSRKKVYGDEVHDNIVDIDHQKIPSIRGHGNQEGKKSTRSWPVPDHDQHTTETSSSIHHVKKRGGKRAMKEAKLRKSKQLIAQLVVDQPRAGTKIFGIETKGYKIEQA